LVDQAFTPRIPGLRITSRYKTSPLEKALQDAFHDEYLFGGQHDDPSNYFTKVAITAATDTGEQPVIFTNYNRQIETQGACLHVELTFTKIYQQATRLYGLTITVMS
jgi:hypothetical protein